MLWAKRIGTKHTLISAVAVVGLREGHKVVMFMELGMEAILAKTATDPSSFAI